MTLRSSIEIYDLETRSSRVVWQTEQLVESPHFTPDGRTLIFNSDGLIYRLPIGGKPERIDTGFAIRCNNDHGLSPDGRTLIITDKSDGRAAIYTVPVEGGTPVRITDNFGSYYHGWSGDGARITYTAFRQRDVFAILTNTPDGRNEQVVIEGGGLNDGPDFSADGQWVWFNSDRSGHMQLWRARTHGSDRQRMSDSDHCDWFPHPSPDGRHVLFLSYDTSVGRDHPRDKTIWLKLMPAVGGASETLLELFGGQGTMNVPNWLPGGKSFAFVRYFPESS
ncbi:TolB family protein [Asticcacaulis sp. YBE204]|uniref:TolB family protein n=1 Tax=Asticcacaulis sp. YBE204 TaxID=1282363 RepID=UPI0003C3D6EC|nr:TolB family protein [Asticcacaulis sp. YBE204]ESQ78100.1 hypothetical protein AEYBE204_14750 [Asticcacaulis sp. YBE204]